MSACSYRFTALPGYFVDNVAAANSSVGAKPVTARTRPNLGLIDRQYQGSDQDDKLLPWVRFRRHVEKLNREGSLTGESYKVLFLVRHGLSVHNVVMADVGSKEWKSNWSRREGNGTVTWVDAHLTDEGIKQTMHLGELWTEWTKEAGVPLPDTVYTSPLARCLETTKLVYSNVVTQHGGTGTFQPIVKESLRERLTDHTCDKRSSKSWIEERYPDYVLEPGFVEKDVLWKADAFETDEAHTARKQRLLEDIWINDREARFISLTTHSYAISAILEVVGAPHFRVGEGEVVALLVKGEKVAGLKA